MTAVLVIFALIVGATVGVLVGAAASARRVEEAQRAAEHCRRNHSPADLSLSALVDATQEDYR